MRTSVTSVETLTQQSGASNASRITTLVLLRPAAVFEKAARGEGKRAYWVVCHDTSRALEDVSGHTGVLIVAVAKATLFSNSTKQR